MELLVSLLIVAVVIVLIFYVLDRIPLPEPWNWVVRVIVGLVVLLWLLRMLGVWV